MNHGLLYHINREEMIKTKYSIFHLFDKIHIILIHIYEMSVLKIIKLFMISWMKNEPIVRTIQKYIPYKLKPLSFWECVSVDQKKKKNGRILSQTLICIHKVWLLWFLLYLIKLLCLQKVLQYFILNGRMEYCVCSNMSSVRKISSKESFMERKLKRGSSQRTITGKWYTLLLYC